MSNKSVSWEKHANWLEAEGSVGIRLDRKLKVRKSYIFTVTQHVSRREIADVLCKELRDAGFKSATSEVRDKQARCGIVRAEEQYCFLTRVLPHIISRQKREEVEATLAFIRRERPRIGRPRIPFECPP